MEGYDTSAIHYGFKKGQTYYQKGFKDQAEWTSSLLYISFPFVKANFFVPFIMVSFCFLFSIFSKSKEFKNSSATCIETFTKRSAFFSLLFF